MYICLWKFYFRPHCKLAFNVKHIKYDNSQYKRFFSETNRNNFLCSLRQQNWLDVRNIDRSKVNDQWNEFMRIFKYHFDQHFPKTVVHISHWKRNLYKESNILECKRDLSVWHRISRSNNKSKCMWTICKEISGKNEWPAIAMKGDAEQIANSFNHKLVSIFDNLLRDLPGEPFDCRIKDNVS